MDKLCRLRAAGYRNPKSSSIQSPSFTKVHSARRWMTSPLAEMLSQRSLSRASSNVF